MTVLELKNIVKVYPAGGARVEALKGVDLCFRKQDFVCILGPSGCGKTTLLNLIGGLDRATSGDLVIDGKSTSRFRDRDWDTYRNHTIGFVFQTYNLIPHQSVLQNVELALTLSGVSKRERKSRAKKALCDVGLADQIKKKPNTLSGGQMQRVAIARALVNDPDVILADEPTGALDSETSVQVMDLLKEIAKERLVIMVTHNAELAERYATRTIRMLDGRVTSDSAPLDQAELDRLHAEDEKTQILRAKNPLKKPGMKLHTGFALSFKNLFTKKGRTILTSFAGSIGIIGIALIYAVSQGMTSYIDSVQEDTLSSYPLTLEEQNIDLSSLMKIFMDTAVASEEHELDAVYEKSVAYELVNSLSNLETSKNDLAAFKTYLETRIADTDDPALSDALSGVQYGYHYDFTVYTESPDGTITKSDPTELLQTLFSRLYGRQVVETSDASGSRSSVWSDLMTRSPSGGSRTQVWQEMLPGRNGELISPILKEQYELIDGGRWPEAYDEVVLVLDENNELGDLTLYALGLLDRADVEELIDAAAEQRTVEMKTRTWSYEDLRGLEFRTILPADCYSYDELSQTYTDLRDTDAGMRYLYSNGLQLKVTGIVRPTSDTVSKMLNGSVAYTSALTEYLIEHSRTSPAVEAQLEQSDTDIFTGLKFHEATDSMTEAEKAAEFRAEAKEMTVMEKSAAFVKIQSIMPKEMLDSTVEQALSQESRQSMEEKLSQALTGEMGLSEDRVREYIASMSDEELEELFTQAITQQTQAAYAAQAIAELGGMTPPQLAAALDAQLDSYTDALCALYFDEVLEFSGSTYEDNLETLGYFDLDQPATINLYASSFADKDAIEQAVKDYNAEQDETHKISYTDYVGLIMSSVTTIIDAITYVLIAFVAISLVVSSIMIGVITLISVQERTKEIGILRAIGASKRNVSAMFNAETVTIGFFSGLLGVGLTYLLCLPINLILHTLTGIQTLSAYLPIPTAITLVVISMLLTLIAGIIPSRSAAKKDPVVALRTE